ncbi:MAG: hypothetical protein ACYDC6_07745 [Acidobacteriaceae bacterium]
MKFALNFHVLIAHWVPGFLVVMAMRPVLLSSTSPVLKSLLGTDSTNGPIAVLSIVVAAFLVGEVLDAVRDLLLENILDRFQPLKWEFLASGETDKIENFKSYYFTYYVFDWNVSLALAIAAGLAISMSAPYWTYAVLGIPFIIFVVNAFQLRGEMKPLMVLG